MTAHLEELIATDTHSLDALLVFLMSVTIHQHRVRETCSAVRAREDRLLARVRHLDSSLDQDIGLNLCLSDMVNQSNERFIIEVLTC